MPAIAALPPRTGLAIFLAAGLVANTAAAEDKAGPSISGTLNATYQHATAQSANNEFNSQLVIESLLPMTGGSWNMETKGGTTPKAQGVAAQIPEANGLVGETTDGNGNGRFAVTQLYYSHPLFNGVAEGGMLFPARLIDTNAIADDETTEFLAAPFINNPTLDMPVYNLGIDYQGKVGEQCGYTALVSSTTDLEGGDHSYDNLFAIRASGQGAFNAFEVQWQAVGLNGNLGLWNNTASHELLDGSGRQEANYGIYTNIGGSRQAWSWNLRAGLANRAVSEAANFIGVNLAYGQPALTLGVGLGRTGPSGDIPKATAATLSGELYARARLAPGLFVTPDLEWIRHSQFSPDDNGTWVLGMRAGAEF